jgi:hypothetical protein
MRKSLVLLASLLAQSASYGQAAEAIRSADATIWLEVLSDHFELQGKSYTSRSGLTEAIRTLRNPEQVAIHWIVDGGNETQRMAVLSKVSEAALAAHDAGLRSVAVVGNEVFH